MEKYVGPVVTALANLIAPNFVWAFMLLASFAYYFLSIEGDSPTWRNVAVGSMAIIGTLAGIGYRHFLRALSEMREEMREDREKRDKQHKGNVSAMLALAMAGQDKEKIEAVIDRLLSANT